jgi:hypothetical protein
MIQYQDATVPSEITDPGQLKGTSQAHAVHWSSPDPGDEYHNVQVEDMIDELLHDDPVVPAQVKSSGLKTKKLTLRIGSEANLTLKLALPIVFESPDKLAFSIHKDGVESRPVRILEYIDYEFRMQVAGEFHHATDEMDLVWKTNRMAKGASWCELSSLEDFQVIMRQAKSFLAAESELFRLMVAKNAADAASAKRHGKYHVPKHVPPVHQFVIFVRDRNYERKMKAPKNTKV